jgi:hypothetical protein
MLLSLVAHAVWYKIIVGAHNTVYVRRLWEVLSCSPSMGIDGTHNTVGQMSVPTTLLGFRHAWKVAASRAPF